MSSSAEVSHFPGTCSLCEASCGCIWEVQQNTITRVLPDKDDPLSEGFLCPKGRAIPELEADADRLRSPLVRIDGELKPTSWEQAYSEVERLLGPVLRSASRDSIGLYIGNGAAHNHVLTQYAFVFAALLKSRNIFTSGTVDQIPRQVVSALLYGSPASVPVPDLDRTDLLWVFGANPLDSNGSLLTAPGIGAKLRDVKARGGRIVVFDPRRSATARVASDHYPIRVGSDAAFLASVANVLIEDGRSFAGHAAKCTAGLSECMDFLKGITPEFVSQSVGIAPETIRRLAHELKEAPKAALYGRMGTTTTQFGTLTCWLMDLVSILSGSLDVVGGNMFARPLHMQDNSAGIAGSGAGVRIGRWHSRVSKRPEVLGEIPAICMPEEIETAGPDQIRALVLVAANPCLSNPDPERVERALSRLEAFISMDIYVNESNKHAHVILPSPPRLAKPNYDAWFFQFALRNYGRFTKAYRPLMSSERSDRETFLRLASIVEGRRQDIDQLDEEVLKRTIQVEIGRPNSPIAELTVDQVFAKLLAWEPALRRLDLNLRIGPYGDAFGRRADGISLAYLEKFPTGLDLGPLHPRLTGMLRTRSGKIELKHDFVAAEVSKLKRWISAERAPLVLTGRRQLRSNNSWMHNIAELKHAKNRCTLLVNPEDAAERSLTDGSRAKLTSSAGTVEVTLRIDDAMSRGAVSLPHGWGHVGMGRFQHIAAGEPGVNINELVDGNWVDEPTGTAVLNGIPVTLSAAP